MTATRPRHFEWTVPEYFNFGATIDHFAEDPQRVALLWEDQEGRRARLTFADLRSQSNRIANILEGVGLRRGDPVLLVLPRISLWQAAYIGALKAGALVIPCTSMLRETCRRRRRNELRRHSLDARNVYTGRPCYVARFCDGDNGHGSSECRCCGFCLTDDYSVWRRDADGHDSR